MRKVLSILALCFMSAHALADDAAVKTPRVFHEEENTSNHFLLEAGYIGAMTTDQSNFSDFQHGFSGGLLIDAFGRRYFTFESGVFATQEGLQYTTDTKNLPDGNQASGATVTGQLFYIGVPLLCKVNLMGRLTNTMYLIGGAIPQFLIAKNLNVQGTGANGAALNNNYTGDSYDVPGFDVTGTIGLGGDIALNRKQSILLQATYNRGFVPLDYDQPNPGTYNQSFMLTVGFGVDL